MKSINPATGLLIHNYPEMSAPELDLLVERAQVAQERWKRSSYAERGARLRSAAAQLRGTLQDSARLITLEMGKPIRQARAEVEKCAAGCEFYADHGEELLAPEPVGVEEVRCSVVFEPLGMILAIMPWNFPFWQVFRCAAPALMAGNAVVLKHASNVSGCALAIERIFQDAGLPRDLFRTVLIPSAKLQDLIGHRLVRGVSLTGSVEAGRAVAARAGAHLKKTVLELGGSDPYVVLEDAELDLAVEKCVQSRLINSGQSCIAAKRFIVVESALPEFQARFVERLGREKMGDPLEEATTIGPLAREDLRLELHRQVQQSVAAGAKLLLGGQIPNGAGWFYPPTVLTNVKPGMAAYAEETFGPVAAIISARTEAEAIRIANDTSFGLGAAVFTRDRVRGERIAARELEAGNCFVNDFVRSDPRLPFGGIKDSGYGRELSGYGLREFVNIKTVWVK